MGTADSASDREDCDSLTAIARNLVIGITLCGGLGWLNALIVPPHGVRGWLHWSQFGLSFWLGGHTTPRLWRWWRARRAGTRRQVDDLADEPGRLADGLGEVDRAEG